MSQLQPIKGQRSALALGLLLTDESIPARNGSEVCLSALGLRLFGHSQYPLRQVRVTAGGAPELLSKLLAAVVAVPTLELPVLDSDVPNDILASSALQLKAAPNLRTANMSDFPIDAGLQLLQSRTDWVRIILPSKAGSIVEASAFAPSNRTDFELCAPADVDTASLNYGSARRRSSRQFPESCFDALQHCKNLTFLVRALSHGSMWSSCAFSPFNMQHLRQIEQKLSAHYIPQSVVLLQLENVTLELVKGLLATRSKRELQNVD
jgi:hypothetical protein